MTRQPACAREVAADKPAKPAPITTARFGEPAGAGGVVAALMAAFTAVVTAVAAVVAADKEKNRNRRGG